MKKVLIGLFGLSVQASLAQQDQLQVSEGSNPGDWNLDWDGVSGRFYTLQCSTDLVSWQYMPAIKYGAGAHGFGFASSSPKTFVRLEYMDVVTSNPLGGDIDGDGLTNQQEIYTHGTSPFQADSDGDGIDDLYEVNNSVLDPLFAGDALQDPDGDNLVNLWEFKLGLNPAVANTDSDGDGLVNALENYLGNQYSATNSDTDGDGTIDADEDHDSDGLTTIMEFGTYGTEGLFHDTDGDTLSDGWEALYGFNPLMLYASGPQSASADPDGDGLTNQEESNLGTNPNNTDTDSDGVDDQTETNQGSNPLDPNDSMPPPAGTTSVNFRFGDPNSSSVSEKYRLKLTPLEGDTTGHTERFRTNTQYGSPSNVTFQLPKGSKYKVELVHIDTTRRKNGSPDPDYDYEVELLTATACVALEDDPQPFLGNHYQQGATTTFLAAGKSATLYVSKFDWVTPKESPVIMPNDKGDGQNEFTYDNTAAGVLTINLKVLVEPTGTAGVTDYKGIKFSDRCVYTLPPIAGSTFMWDAANPGGKSNPSGNHVVAKATYSTLPSLNSEFGLKEADFKCDGMIPVEIDHTTDPFVNPPEFEVFYTGTATNHRDIANPTFPNWFVYYKQNEGGGSYTYDAASSTSNSIAGGGDGSIKIADNAYTGGDTLITTINSNGRLKYLGRTPFRKRYKYFYGVVQHERQHANNETPGVNDPDGDDLSTQFENNTSKTDPNDRFSADPSGGISDDEVYAGGPVEEAAINAADTSQDWANPGTNNKSK